MAFLSTQTKYLNITILQSSSGISRAPHADHDQSHEEEEESHNEADSVDCEVSYGVLALYLDVSNADVSNGLKDRGTRCPRLFTEWDLGQPVLDTRGQHEAGEDKREKEEEAVHDPRACRVLAARTQRTASRAGRGGEAAGEAGEADDSPHPGLVLLQSQSGQDETCPRNSLS